MSRADQEAGERGAADAVTPLALVAVALAALVLLATAVRLHEARDDARDDGPAATSSADGDRRPRPDDATRSSSPEGSARPGRPRPADPDAWRDHRVLAPGRTLVAYYGTSGTGALGVLGESRPEVMRQRLARQIRAWSVGGRDVQPVYELIVTVVDPVPGEDGSFSHHLSRAQVAPYVGAARRHGARLVLDVQPGRDGFLETVKHWRWALERPWVGLALDPEWRMAPGEVPGQVIGSVSAAEVNRTSAWLSRLVRHQGLPEKPFVLHQFRTDMVPDIGRVRPRPGLAMIQHVDGFGTPQQKLATYRAVARPDLFSMGFKLFYDEDVRLMSPRDVHRLRPAVRFVSYQ